MAKSFYALFDHLLKTTFLIYEDVHKVIWITSVRNLCLHCAMFSSNLSFTFDEAFPDAQRVTGDEAVLAPFSPPEPRIDPSLWEALCSHWKG